MKGIKMSINKLLIVVITSALALTGLSGITSAASATDCTPGQPCIILDPPPQVSHTAPPVVTKTHRAGIIRACEPSRAHHGRKITLSYGSFRQPQPDGHTTIRPGHCKLIRVHRHRIDWLAQNAHNGRFVATGHVRHIRL